LKWGGESTDLLFAYDEKLFGNIPVVLITSDRQHLPNKIMNPNMTSLSWGFDIKKTVKIIQDARPQTKKLFIISGTSQIDQSINKLALEALRENDAKLNVENLNDTESIEKDNLLMFDWRQLKRWGIPEQRLPEGSIVTHRKKKLF